MSCDACNTECKNSADGRTVFEIDANHNLCGCGASCTTFCGASCDGASNAVKYNHVYRVEIPDVAETRYNDMDVYDNSKTKFT